ncbi:hypothetical protein M3B90_07835 [Dermabacter sp. p3-SID358]|uniref:hypothetical protein n=1 Tax=Dermabacter sp. p3-SID358 TaxID=2916114 RepID=UPI0021A92FD6|nr:hypothetical protein [Dermabacter sp. p3-SID358]MCT1867435.1 hypothetical protein [Dermabacter sp. p3-SID358]
MTTSPFVRLTIRGQERAADVIVPGSLTPSDVIPEFMELVRESTDVSSLGMFTILGERLHPTIPVGEQDLLDGQVVQVLPLADAPFEPVVHDVVDRLTATDVRGLWNDNTRSWVLGILSTGLLLVSLWFIPGVFNKPWWPVAGMFALTIGAAALRIRTLAWPFFIAALFLSILGGLNFSFAGRESAIWWLSVLAAILAVVGVMRRRSRALATSLATLAGGTGLFILAHFLGASIEQSGAIVAVVALAALGLVPRLVMQGSGLYKVQDALAEEKDIKAKAVDVAIAEAYETLTMSVVVLAVIFAASLSLAAPLVVENPFAAITLAAVGIAVVFRTRHFPFALHRAVLWGAIMIAGTFCAQAIVNEYPGSTLWIGLGAIAIAFAMYVIPRFAFRSTVNSALGRRISGVVERICTLATVPALVGIFGVYSELLRTFQ